jgi:hypothetical protein
MQRFRSMKTLLKFSAVHAQVRNSFNQERPSRGTPPSKDARPPWRSGVLLRRRSSFAAGIVVPGADDRRYFDKAFATL